MFISTMLHVTVILAGVFAGLQTISGQTCSGAIRGVIDGNVTLGMFFSFRGSQPEGNSCSDEVPYRENIQLIEAARFALQNTQGTIPGVKIGLEAYDTCGSSKVGIVGAVSFLSDGQVFLDEDMLTCSGSTLKPGVLVSRNDDTESSLETFLSDAQLPIIGLDNTLSEFTKSERYPYFTRALPSDDFQALAITNIIETLGWNYVATFHSENTADMGAFKAFKIAANRTSICISVSKSVKTRNLQDSTYDSLLRSFLSINLKPRVVVLFLPSDQLDQFFKAVARSTGTTKTVAQQIQWIVGYRGLTDPSIISSLPHGLLGVIPKALTQNITQDFDSFFKSLAPNKHDFIADPWFKMYWEEKFTCNLDSNKFAENCNESNVERHIAAYQRHPYVPAVLDSVKVFTEALKLAHQTLCSGASGICTSLQQLSYKSFYEYVLRVSTVGKGSQKIRHTPSGDLSVNTFSIVNYKTDGTVYVLQEVGSWEDGNITLPIGNLELWSNGNSNQTIYSTCGDTCLDPMCVSNRDRLDREIYLPGDIIIGGMFNIHPAADSNSPCGTISESGVQRLEAMLYALDLLNNDDTILPDLRIGMDGMDTCGNKGRAGHQALQIIADADFKSSGSGQREGAKGKDEHLYAIVGPEGDDECMQVSDVLQLYDMPMVSYAADSATLSNTFFYPNFARVLAPSTNQITALLGTIYTKGWFYMQAIFSSSKYGLDNVNVLIQQAPQRQICLTQHLQMPTSADAHEAWDKLFQNLETRKDAKVLLIIADNTAEFSTVLDQMITRNLIGKYYLLATDGWPMLDDEFTRTYTDAIKGVTVVGKLNRQYDAFRDYFASLSPPENVRNPWFNEYWMDKFNCSLPGIDSTLTPCTGSETVLADNVFDIHLADVVDSVYTVAHLVQQLQTSKCPGQTGICQEMIDTGGDELFAMIRTLQFDSINDGRRVKFDYQGNADTEFEVFNYQEQTDGTFSYMKVGSYRTYTYVQQGYLPMKLYNSAGEISNPTSLCQGVCADCTKSDKGKTAEVKNGDAYIGGFFRLHELANNQHDCKDEMILYNMQYMEAFLYAIDTVNSDADVLPSLSLGGVAFDTCGSAKRARRDAANFISATVEYRSGYPQNRVVVSGIIGEQTSDVTLALADVVTPLQVPQISYAATTTVLDDNETYPYFQRTVASDSYQADALIDILRQMYWQYISVVYSDDAYGNDMYNLIVEKTKSKEICIAMSSKIPIGYDEGGFQSVIKTLRGNPQANVVLLLTSDYDTRDILQAAETLGVNDLQWVGTDSWGSRKYVTEKSPMTSKGAIVLQFREVDDPGFMSYYSSLSPYSNTRNPWWKLFISRKYKCNLYGYDVPQDYDHICSWNVQNYLADDRQEPEVTYIILAVKAFAAGLHSAMLELCPDKMTHLCNEVIENPKVLQEKVRAARVPLDSGDVFQFDKDTGNGPALYDILNIHGADNSSLNYTKVGSWVSGRITLNKNKIKAYNGDDSVSSVISVCVGRCAECVLSTSSPGYIHVDGQLQVPGLFALHENGNYLSDCGTLRLSGLLNIEAMLYAIDMINNNADILPGITLGSTLFDTCLRAPRAVRELSSLLGGSHVSLSTNQIWSSTVGVIGPETDDATLTTSQLTNQYKYTQISYAPGDDSPSLDSYLYRAGPFASDSSKAMGVIDVLGRYSWTYILVVYSGNSKNVNDARAFIEVASKFDICIASQHMLSENKTHSAVIDDLLAFQQVDVVVAFLNSDDIHMLQIQLVIRGDSARHITWILAYPDDLKTDNFIIGGGDNNVRSFTGCLAIRAKEVIPSNFREYVRQLRVTNNQRNPWFTDYIENTYHCSAVDSTNFPVKCSGDEGVSDDLITNSGTFVGSIIDSVTTIAKGIHNLLTDKCPQLENGMCAQFLISNPSEFKEAIESVTFTQGDGSTVGFSDHAVIPNFELLNYQRVNNINEFVKVGYWQPGKLIVMGNILLYKGTEGQMVPGVATSVCTDRSVCNHCFSPTTPVMTTPTVTTPAPVPTSASRPTSAPMPTSTSMPTSPTPMLTTTKSNPVITTTPKSTTEKLPTVTTKSRHTTKEAKITTETKIKTTGTASPTGVKAAIVGASELDSTWFYVMVIFAVIGMILTVIVALLVIYRWKQPVAQAMSPFLMLMVLLGVFQMFTLVIVFAVPVSVPVCALQRLVSGFGFAMCHAGLFLMSVRLYRMGRHRTISGPKTSFIQTGSQMVLFLFLAAYQVVLDVEWLILEPPSLTNKTEKIVKTDTSGILPPNIQQCAYSTYDLEASFIYVFILLLLNLGVTLVAKRRIAHMVSMSLMQINTILLVNIGSIVILIIWLVLGAVVSEDFHRPSVSIVATINGFLVLAAVFGYRLKILLTNHDPFEDTRSVISGDYGMTTKLDVPDGAFNIAFENPAVGITDFSESESYSS